MTRLLKKCIFLSVGLHVVVAALLIAAAAFFITKPEKVTPTLSMIAPEVLDNLLNPQTAPAQARVTPAPTPPQPPVQRNRTPEPPTPRPPKKVAPVPTPTPPKKVTRHLFRRGGCWHWRHFFRRPRRGRLRSSIPLNGRLRRRGSRRYSCLCWRRLRVQQIIQHLRRNHAQCGRHLFRFGDEKCSGRDQ